MNVFYNTKSNVYNFLPLRKRVTKMSCHRMQVDMWNSNGGPGCESSKCVLKVQKRSSGLYLWLCRRDRVQQPSIFIFLSPEVIVITGLSTTLKSDCISTYGYY